MASAALNSERLLSARLRYTQFFPGENNYFELCTTQSTSIVTRSQEIPFEQNILYSVNQIWANFHQNGLSVLNKFVIAGTCQLGAASSWCVIVNITTAKSRAVDRSTIQFWKLLAAGHKYISIKFPLLLKTFWKCLGVLITETVYCSRLYSILLTHYIKWFK